MKDNRSFVLFVCEHGSAKSVVAAAHFEKQAQEKGLSVRAISRGTDPDKEIPLNVLQGLESDGLRPSEAKPAPLRDEDVSDAIHVVSFCSLSQNIGANTTLSWEDVPAVSEDYDSARDEISKRIGKLLSELLNEVQADR